MSVQAHQIGDQIEINGEPYVVTAANSEEGLSGSYWTYLITHQFDFDEKQQADKAQEVTDQEQMKLSDPVQAETATPDESEDDADPET